MSTGEIVPKKINNVSQDYAKFVEFVFKKKQRYINFQILRETFESEAETSGGERLLLTAAVAAAKVNIDKAYEIDKLSPYVDISISILIIFDRDSFFF